MELEAPDRCYFNAGETGVLLPGGRIEHPRGGVYNLADCTFEADAGFHLEEPYRMDPATLPAPEAPPVTPPAEAPPAPDFAAVTTAPDPTTAASELQGLVGAAGGDSTVAIALAAIAVLGGGAAWKFYQKKAEQTHELRMEEMKLKAQSQTPSQSPPPCIMKHGELDARLAAVEAKADAAATKAKAAGLPAGFDPDDLEDRIAKLEKAAKAKGRA